MNANRHEMTARGRLVFGLSGVGTKSECERPFLEFWTGARVEVYVDGDNPFENASARAYRGKFVAVSGLFRDGTFVASSICPYGKEAE